MLTSVSLDVLRKFVWLGRSVAFFASFIMALTSLSQECLRRFVWLRCSVAFFASLIMAFRRVNITHYATTREQQRCTTLAFHAAPVVQCCTPPCIEPPRSSRARFPLHRALHCPMNIPVVRMALQRHRSVSQLSTTKRRNTTHIETLSMIARTLTACECHALQRMGACKHNINSTRSCMHVVSSGMTTTHCADKQHNALCNKALCVYFETSRIIKNGERM